MQFAIITIIVVLSFLQETFSPMLETLQVVFLGKIWLPLLVGEKNLHSCQLIWLFLIQLNEYPQSSYYLPNTVPGCWKQKKLTPSLLSNNLQSSRRKKICTQEIIRDQFCSSVILIISSSNFYLLITYSCQILFLLFYIRYLCELSHTKPVMRSYHSCLTHEEIVAQRNPMTCPRSYLE